MPLAVTIFTDIC